MPFNIRNNIRKGIGALADRYTDDDDTISWTNVGKDALMASTAYAALNPNDSETLDNFMNPQQQFGGYQDGVPNYTASRELVDDAFATTYTDPITQELTARRPGSAGRRYFTDTTFAPDTLEPTMGKTAIEIAAENKEALDNQAIYESLMGNAFDTRVASEAAEAETALVEAEKARIAEAKAATDAEIASVFANIPVDGDYNAREVQQVMDGLNAGTITALQAANYFGVDENVVLNFLATQGAGTKSVVGGGGPAAGGPAGDAGGGGPAGVVGAGGPAGVVGGGGPAVTTDVVDTITAANAAELDTFGTVVSIKSQEDIEGLMKGITAGKWDAGDVAEQFNVPEIDVLEELLRNGLYGFEDNAIAEAAAGVDMEEEELVVQLLRAGKTDFAEVAAYYQDRYPGITAEQVETNYNNTEFAQGGNVNGYYLGGPTDGMADQIPATIDNSQPAALSDGEFVIPADIVSHLGNGNSEAGADNLYDMMERVRTDRTGNPNQGRQIDPNKYLA